MKIKELTELINAKIGEKFNNRKCLGGESPYPDEYEVGSRVITPMLKELFLKDTSLDFEWRLDREEKNILFFRVSQKKAFCQLLPKMSANTGLSIITKRKKNLYGVIIPQSVEFHFEGLTQLEQHLKEMDIADMLSIAAAETFSIKMMNTVSNFTSFGNAIAYLAEHGITDINELSNKVSSLFSGYFSTLRHSIGVSASWDDDQRISVPYALMPVAISRLYSFMEEFLKEHKEPWIQGYFSQKQKDEMMEVRQKMDNLGVLLSKNTAYILIDKKLPYFNIKEAMKPLLERKYMAGDDILYAESLFYRISPRGYKAYEGILDKDCVDYHDAIREVKDSGIWYSFSFIRPMMIDSGTFSDGSHIPAIADGIVIVITNPDKSEICGNGGKQ